MKNFIHSRKENKTCWKKFKMMLLVVHLSFWHKKQLLMTLLFENQQTYANKLLELTLTNNTPTRCVNPCRPVFIRVGISFQRRVDSRFEITTSAALKLWSCPTFNEHDKNVKMEASLQQADRRKLTRLVLTGFALIATLCLKPWIAFTTSVPVKRYDPLSVKRKLNAVSRKENSMHWDDTINRRKASMFLKYGSADGGHCRKQSILLSKIPENTFLTGVHLQLSKCLKR